MDVVDDTALIDQHNWFTTSLQAQGMGKVNVPKREVVFAGPTSITLDRKNAVAINLEIQDVSPENFDLLEIVMHFHELEAFTLETADGIYSASKVGCSGMSIGNTEKPGHFNLSPSILEFVASTEKPYYWVMPLGNLLQDFLQRGETIGQHPLRLEPDTAVVEFLWQGKPAFIEPLLDYEQRMKMLENGKLKHVLTAVMVGEIGDNPTDVDNIDTWFPATLLRVLGFATGHEVAAPWIEFRDVEGKLVKRIHRDMGAPDFVSGHRTIEEYHHPLGAIFAAAENKTPLTVKVTQHHLGKLLEAVQSTPFCQTSTFFVLLHQALRAGAGGQKIEDRLTHLFKAFDRLCQEHDFRTIFLRNELISTDKAEAMSILDKASKEIRILASQANARGDIKAKKALDLIAQRVKAADQTDRDFGSAMCMLVQKFGFHDETVMNAYFAANPLASVPTWASILTQYRNVAIHDGYFDTSNPTFSQRNLYSMNVHLQDLLARILLVMSGYDGPYHPVSELWARSQDYIDRVQPTTPANKLGYD